MNAQLETRIIEQLHQLDEHRLCEVLDFVTRQLSEKEKSDWKPINPTLDLAKFRRIRDVKNDNQPVTPQFGNCKGMLTMLVEDEEYLKDFEEYLA